MDKVRFSCPRCQTIMQTGAEKIGYDVACPHCAHRFRLIESSDPGSNSDRLPTGSADAATLPPSRFPSGADGHEAYTPISSNPAPPQSYPSPGTAKNYGGQAPVIGRAPASQPAFSCPYCGTHNPPIWKSEVSTVGWIVFAVLLVTTCVFCWVGLFIRDRFRVCSKCRIRLG